MKTIKSVSVGSFVHGQAYKMVLSAAGAVVSPRRAIGRAREQTGSPIRRQHDGRWYSFPAWEREHNGNPFYLVEEGKSPARRIDLPWAAHRIRLVHDALVNDREVVLLATPDLQLFRFARQGGGLATLHLGAPHMIYSFPRASNLAPHGDTYLVCWIDRNQRLLLSQWATASGQSKTVVLATKTNWNTSLSIGVIGHTLLLAYHGLGAQGSVIQTVTHALPLR